VDQVDHGDHDPPWWTRSVQDHRGPLYDIFLMNGDAGATLNCSGGASITQNPRR